MEIVWIPLVFVAVTGIALLPLRYLRPKAKRIYSIVLLYACALLWGALPVYIFPGDSIGFVIAIFATIATLTGATRTIVHTRVCQRCGAFVGLRRGLHERHACNPDDLLVDMDAAALAPTTAPAAGPPAGFRLATAPNGDLRIAYRTTGMESLALFLILFTIAWILGASYITHSMIAQGRQLPYLNLVAIWSPVPLLVGHVSWYFFSETAFTLTNNSLTARRKLGPVCRERIFERSALRTLKIVKDGGYSFKDGFIEDRDSFPSWALVATGLEEIAILSKQPHAQVVWLGALLAKWSGLTLKDGGDRVLPHFRKL